MEKHGEGSTNLDEANILGVVAEALSADVHLVLADQTVSIGADAAEDRNEPTS